MRVAEARASDFTSALFKERRDSFSSSRTNARCTTLPVTMMIARNRVVVALIAQWTNETPETARLCVAPNGRGMRAGSSTYKDSAESAQIVAPTSFSLIQSWK